MKPSVVSPMCAIALVASLAACGGSGSKSGLPTITPGASTPGASPSATATSQPTKTPTTSGPVPLAAKSTNTYGGLNVVVNLPADIPEASRPSLRLFSEFAQADARTIAGSKLDPSLSNLASPSVVKDTKASITAESVEGIGSVTYTISTVRTAGGSAYALITGCLDQSKIVHVRKDGSHFVDPRVKKHPRIKMVADINRGVTGPKVTSFTFAEGSC